MMTKRLLHVSATVATLLVGAFLPHAAQARVVRMEITSRAGVLEDKAFDEAGTDEKLIGKVHFAVKPEAAPNKLIVDLHKAPRTTRGKWSSSSRPIFTCCGRRRRRGRAGRCCSRCRTAAATI